MLFLQVNSLLFNLLTLFFFSLLSMNSHFAVAYPIEAQSPFGSRIAIYKYDRTTYQKPSL